MSRPVRTLIALLLLLSISACGSDETSSPTPTPAPPTAAPDQMTVADVVGMADAAWPSVRSMRTTSQSSEGTTGDTVTAFTGSVQDWTANGDRHIIEFQDGVAINEHIYVHGAVYMRGGFVSSALAQGIDVNTWVVVDPATVDADSPVGVQVTYLTRTQANPYGELTPDVLVRPVQESGTVAVGDRTCNVYTFGDETNTGTEIRYEIAVGEDGLPCQVIQRAGDFQNSTVYEFNLDLSVNAPLEATPEATPATPPGA